jgi:hypothetical protein
VKEDNYTFLGTCERMKGDGVAICKAPIAVTALWSSMEMEVAEVVVVTVVAAGSDGALG